MASSSAVNTGAQSKEGVEVKMLNRFLFFLSIVSAFLGSSSIEAQEAPLVRVTLDYESQ